jgi:hypothetical protein
VRGMLCPQENLTLALNKMIGRWGNTIQNLPRGTPITDMAWQFGSQTKWLSDECSQVDLLVVIEALSRHIWTLGDKIVDLTPNPQFVENKEPDVALELLK